MPPPATVPAHPPPPSESTTTTCPEQPRSPPPPPSGVECEALPKRRKVEEVGFQRSPYYTIRETIANLRGRFLQVEINGMMGTDEWSNVVRKSHQDKYFDTEGVLNKKSSWDGGSIGLSEQVCQGTDSQKNDAAVEILKEMKDVMELSKKTRFDLSSAAEPVKQLDKPAARAPEDKTVRKVPSAEKSQVPPTSLAGNFVHSTGMDVPLKPDNSDPAAHRLLMETKKVARPSKTTDHTNKQGGLPHGSYVIGGSPIGWNFLMWPGCKSVYYGLTKAEWLARRSAK